MSPCLTYVKSWMRLRRILQSKYDVNIAGGQDHLKGKLFRINQMGLIKPYEACWLVNSIELALSDMGVREYQGVANELFTQRYFRELKEDYINQKMN